MFGHKKKSSIGYMITALGLFTLGLFLLLDVTPVDADDVTFPDEVKEIIYSSSGVSQVNNNTATPIGATEFANSSFIDVYDNLFVVWRIDSSAYNYLQYSYFSHASQQWQAPNQLLMQSGGSLSSDDGVEVIPGIKIAADPSLKPLCLLVKYDEDKKGILYYSCAPNFDVNSTRNYFAPPKKLTFEYTAYGEQLNFSVHNFISVAPIAGTQYFYLAMNAGQIEMLNNQESISEDLLRIFKCEIKDSGTSDNDLIINCIREKYFTTAGRDPTMIAVPNGNSTSYYTFFRDNNANIGYAPAVGGNATMLAFVEDAKGNKRKTNKRTAASYININGEYVYVTYKNDNNDGIRFSRTSLSNFIKGATKAWEHCQLGPSNFEITSTVAPSFFNYNNGLYILYANREQQNNFGYYKIDEIVLSGYLCSQD